MTDLYLLKQYRDHFGDSTGLSVSVG